MFLFASLFAALSLLSNVYAESICGKEAIENLSYEYCVHTNPNSTDLMHYMHVSGGNVNSWIKQNTNIKIRDLWTQNGKEIPNVITISFGGQWILTDLQKHQLYIDKILPYLEGKIETPVKRRILLGDSMGGLNSAQLMLKNGDLFERVALNCPAITSIGPFASDDEVEAFVERNKPYISRLKVWAMLRWGKREFVNNENWLRHDSILLARSVQKMPEHIYVSCGDADEFGFIEGAKLLADTLMEKGFNVKWNPVKGGHCIIDTKKVAAFLIP
jgi:hypothetical protein